MTTFNEFMKTEKKGMPYGEFMQPKPKGRKFCLVTKDFSGLGFALDSRNKNDQIIIARNPDMDKFKDKPDDFEKFNNIGKGLVEILDLKDVMSKRSAMKDYFFVFDSNNSVDQNEQLRREGYRVCLGGKEAFRLENDRAYAIRLAESLGMPSPDWKEFKSAVEGIKFLEKNPDKAYVFKPNNADDSYLTTVPSARDAKKANESLRVFIGNIGIDDFVLQEKVKGIEINAEYFCMEGKPILANINLEMKRISNGDLGNMCGCAGDITKVVDLESKIIKMTVAKFLPFIEKQKWTGLFDCNVIIAEQQVYFLEFCARAGYNAAPNFFMNIENRDFLNVCADLQEGVYKPNVNRGIGSSITIFIDHPHVGIPLDMPKEIKNKIYIFDGEKKNGSVVQTGYSNELMIVGGYDYRIKDSIKNAYSNCEKIDIINMDYRSDGCSDDYASSPIRRYQSLQDIGLV